MNKKMVYSLVGLFMASVVFGYGFVSISRNTGSKKAVTEDIKAAAVNVGREQEDAYYSNGKKISDKTSDTKKSDGADEKYLFRDYEGKIAVYRLVSDEDMILYYLTDVDISYLPESDIEEIKKGILIDSRQEMLTLLEDFGS